MAETDGHPENVGLNIRLTFDLPFAHLALLGGPERLQALPAPAPPQPLDFAQCLFDIFAVPGVAPRVAVKVARRRKPGSQAPV